MSGRGDGDRHVRQQPAKRRPLSGDTRQRRRKHLLMGELALARGLIAPHELLPLLGLQKKWGTRLGPTLLSSGHATPHDIARLVATQRDLPLINLRHEPPDAALLRANDIAFYLAHHCLPWRRVNGEVVYVAADPVEAAKIIAQRNGRLARIHVASARDIQKTVAAHFGEELSELAIHGLERTHATFSASRRTTPSQDIWIGCLALLTLAALLFAPDSSLVALNVILGSCFLGIGALRLLSILIGLTAAPSAEQRAFAQSRPVADCDLPIYTIIVPLFRESAVLPVIAHALQRLDYPAAKLDIKLVFEESDPQTYADAKALNLPGHIEFIRVPDSLPRTKPKACNYALPFVRGRYAVVYDAEDMPEPDQLRKAIAAFDLGDPRLACVQAQLNYYNWNENWLTRQFALEYAAFFDLLLPALDQLRLPIPLGGTSTHFRVDALRACGGWDAYNVTEDADLGIRLRVLGYRCGIINSTTQEEANCRPGNWIRQRSRWVKGWVQTYLVHMRHPVSLFRALGWRGFLGFQLVIGGFSLSNLVHPFFYAVLVNHVFLNHGSETDMPLVIFNLVVLVSGYSLTIIAGMVAVSRRGLVRLIPSALSLPAYWLLISLASYKALYQFVTRPFHWEKTDHGLSRMKLPDIQIAKEPRSITNH
ncbi:MAG: glycosyltransferase [Rhizobiales bacterium]|nr:glycosyltransferase [Hyphomicrobiales bacterium]